MKVLVSWFYILGLNVTEALLMSNALSKILCSKNVCRKEREKKEPTIALYIFLTLTIKRSRVTLIIFFIKKKKNESPVNHLLRD